MTTAPSHPPLHGDPSGEDPFEIIDSPYGQLERWRARALATGAVGATVALNKKVRNNFAARMDAIASREAALTAKADALDQRERQIGVLAAQVADMAGRLATRWDALEQRRADAEREAEDPLPLPPGHVSEEPQPSLNADEEQPAHAEPPGDPSKPDEHSAPAVGKDRPGDARGEFLRLKHPVTRDQAEFPDPELPHPPVEQQPISAGLDEAKEANRGD